MTVLVTGATGFVGRALVKRLAVLHGGRSVFCLVKPDPGRDHAAAVAELQQLGSRVVVGDLNDPTVSAEPAPEIAIVYHLAANIDTAAALRDLRVNDRGTANLLNWLSPVLPGVRVMYTSSVAVLDRCGPAIEPLDESSVCSPRTTYGLTKLRGERILETRSATGHYTYTILRLGTVYGPGAKRGGLFDRLITLTLTDNPLTRLNWPGRVSVIHVDDVVDLLITLAVHRDAANEVYCVANPEAPTIGELTRRIASACARRHRPIALPVWMWRGIRRFIWLRGVQSVASLVAAQTLWRFSLLIDDAFWLDTRKLRTVWTQAPIELDAGVNDMVATIMELITRL